MSRHRLHNGLSIRGSSAAVAAPLTFIQKVAAVETANLLDFWTLNDTVGPTAVDNINALRNGTYVAAPTLQNALFLDGVSKAPLFVPASTQWVNIYTTGGSGLSTLFSGAEGSILLWIKVTLAHWNDANAYGFWALHVDASNIITATKISANNLQLSYVSGGTQKQVTIGAMSAATWQALVTTWSHTNNRVRHYLNGTQQGADLVGPPAFVGTLADAALMALSIGATPGVDNGAMGALWTKELTPTEVLTVSTAP